MFTKGDLAKKKKCLPRGKIKDVFKLQLNVDFVCVVLSTRLVYPCIQLLFIYLLLCLSFCGTSILTLCSFVYKTLLHLETIVVFGWG